MSTSTPGEILRSLMSTGTVVAPGAFTALVGKAVAQAGFDAVYISGGATANTAGVPDVGLLTLTEVCRTIREVSSASGLPTIVDADTGYGEVEMVRRTVVEYERAGAAAMHIEDQVFPKRCGHLDGKTLISIDDMAAKVQAAAETKSKDFVLIARTDARGIEGLDAAIERGNAYHAAGADMIFPEGLASEDEFAEFASSCPGLLFANMTEFGKTPIIPVSRFQELGYDIVIFPVTTQRIAMHAVAKALATIKSKGSVESILSDMQTRQELYDLLGYTPDAGWKPRG
ncbi:MAG: methylisocitrate lyase [Phycisphaerae bacterium]|jgi:methylisocitrate lyase|nr:methylisocitrate lyase [Phycisphaerae bacterium]MBT5582567.1 methylisocitrate lyase [Phycisphaerae bacterium]MBT5656328.1 methylisocitrate lyase [Phycisphaerae bacterium]